MHAFSWLVEGLGQNEISILVLVIDEALLGAVAGIGAFAIGRAMERYRRTQALALELGKVRAEAMVRAARGLALLEAKVWRVVGGPMGEMTLERAHEFDMQFLRERFTRDQKDIIELANKVGGQIADDLVLLGDEQRAVSAYFTRLNAVIWAVPDPTLDPSRLEQLTCEIPRAREALSAFFPRLRRHRLRRLAPLLRGRQE